MSRINKLQRTLLWTEIRARDEFHISDLIRSVPGVPQASIANYLETLRRYKYLERTRRGPWWKLIRNTGILAPWGSGGFFIDPNLGGSSDDPRQRLWQSARIARQFDRLEMLRVAEVSRTIAVNYLKRLEDCGYFLRQGTVLTLLRDTGPAAPIETETGIYDPNDRQYYTVMRYQQFATTEG